MHYFFQNLLLYFQAWIRKTGGEFVSLELGLVNQPNHLRGWFIRSMKQAESKFVFKRGKKICEFFCLLGLKLFSINTK